MVQIDVETAGAAGSCSCGTTPAGTGTHWQQQGHCLPKSCSGYCWRLRMELASAMQVKRSSFRLSCLNYCSDCARHCVCLHHGARFKPNLPVLPLHLLQLGGPPKHPKAQMLYCAPAVTSTTRCHFSAGNCSGLWRLALSARWAEHSRTVFSFAPLTLKSEARVGQQGS